jgi:hypothetical protein
MSILKQLLFIVFISFFFYSVSPINQSPFSSPLQEIDHTQQNFLNMIDHEHATYIAMIKAKHIAKQQRILAEEHERERIWQEKIRKRKEAARIRKLAAIAAKKERIRKAKIAEKKRLLALERKRNRIVAKVDISSQRMKVYKGGKLLHQWKVSTGKKGFSTPTGIYKPTMIEKMHLSRQYNNAPMPYSVFFNGGIAVHGTNSVKRLGSRASHGCVRVATPHAKQLYALVEKSGTDNSYIEIHK